MITLKHAECRRVLERGDRLCADVEIEVEGESKRLVALFAESNENDYDMVMVLQKDADTDVDWYDNDLHAAYVDVTEKLFSDEKGEIHWGAREEFKQKVLAYGGVREQIRSMLEEAKREKVEA